MAKPVFPQQGRILKCYLDNIRNSNEVEGKLVQPLGGRLSRHSRRCQSW